jgi:AraC-like DNA-binding protein
VPAIYEPGLVLVLQGRKQAQLGARVVHYDAMQCLIVPVTTLPRGQVLQASVAKPYVCVRLSCETQALAELLLDSDAPAAEGDAGLQVAPVTAPLLDAAGRLLQLLDHPQDLKALAPLVQREIFYRVLTGPLGPRLRALAQGDGVARRLNRVIEQLTRRYAEPISIDELAEVAHMSPSTLHLRFKQLTALSPLQFQKTLRLQQARRLMLGDGLDAASAAHRVGYESPSQFSREYRRLFGAPPREDISLLRAASA